MSIRSMFDIFV